MLTIKSQAFKRIFSAIFFLYPLFAFLALRYFDASLASLVLSLILIFRLVFMRSSGANGFGKIFDVVLWFVLLNNVLNIYFKSEIALKIYPAMMSLCFFGIFAHSLWIKKPLIEKFARLYEKNITERRLQYIWKLTVIWTCWLFLNTALAFYTAFAAPMETWVLYNNLIFYVICGVLFASDFAYRKLVFDRAERKNSHV
jgi:Predicted membrane protein